MQNRFPATILSLFLLAAAPAARAESVKPAAPSRTQAEVTALLQEFLAHVDETAMHDRFWAADLIYTGSGGTVKTKPEILKSVGEAEAAAKTAATKAPAQTYGAEDIVVRAYGDMAALTFRLVSHTPDGKTDYYRNSGTLIRRDGRWQVVTWQATKVPEAAPAK